VAVVTRGVLERCDRDETQGVAALLVASAANGDQHLTLTVTTVFQTMGFVFTVLDAFMGWSPAAWRELVQSLGWLLRRRRSPAAAQEVAESLEGRLSPEREDGLQGLASDAGEAEPKTRGGRLLKRLPLLWLFVLPLLLVYLVVQLVRMEVQMLRILIVGPLVGAMLRTRRYLGDATAVQLTRAPTEVARGLMALAGDASPPPGGAWLEHLWVAAPQRPTKSSEHPGSIGSHPKLERRLRRLVALGADRSDPAVAAAAAKGTGLREALRRGGSRGVIQFVVFMGFMGPLLLVALYLMAMVVGAILLFAAGASVLFAGGVLRLIDQLIL